MTYYNSPVHDEEANFTGPRSFQHPPWQIASTNFHYQYGHWSTSKVQRDLTFANSPSEIVSALDRGANADEERIMYANPLYRVIMDGDIRLFELLSRQYPYLLDQLRSRNPLQVAISNAKPEMVEKLIECDLAAIDKQDSHGMTPLMNSVVCFDEEARLAMVKILLNARARLDITDCKGWTALNHAIRSFHLKCVRILLNIGSPINNIDKGGKTPLDNALVLPYSQEFYNLANFFEMKQSIVKEINDRGGRVRMSNPSNPRFSHFEIS